MSHGRPRVLSHLKRTELCSLVADGLPLRDAARHVGCHVRTVRREQQRDNAFRHALAEAELAARMEPEKLLRQAAATHWRAAVWLLERGKRRRSPTSQHAASLPHDLQVLSDVLIEAILSQLPDMRTRRLAYENLAVISAAAIGDILTKGAKGLKRRMTTPSTDAVRLEQGLNAISHCGTHDPSRGARPLLKSAERAAAKDINRLAPLAGAESKSRENPPPCRLTPRDES